MRHLVIGKKQRRKLVIFTRILTFVLMFRMNTFFIINLFGNYLIKYSMFLMFLYYINNHHIEHELYKVFVRVRKREYDRKRIADGMEGEAFFEHRKEFLESEVLAVRHMPNFRQQRRMIPDFARHLCRGYHLICDHSAYHSDLQIFEFSFNFSNTNFKVLKFIVYFLKFCMFIYKVCLFLKEIFWGSYWDLCDECLYLSIDFICCYSKKLRKDLKIYIMSGEMFKDFKKFLKGYPYWIQKTVRFLTIELVDLRTFMIFVDQYLGFFLLYLWYALACIYRFFRAIHDHLRIGAEFRSIYIVTVIQSRLVRKFIKKFIGFLLRLTLALNLFWIAVHIYYTFERLYFDLFKDFIDFIIDSFFIIFG